MLLDLCFKIGIFKPIWYKNLVVGYAECSENVIYLVKVSIKFL